MRIEVPKIFSVLYDNLIRFSTPIVSGRFWYLKVASFAYIITFFFSPPDFEAPLWMEEGLNKQIESPFMVQEYPSESHLAKRAMRITMPVLGYYLGLNLKGLLILQSILGFVFFVISARLINLIFKDKILALTIVLGFAFTYIGKACVFDEGMFDGIAFLLILLAMYFRNIFLIFTLIFFASYVDERAIVSSLMVCFWWIIKEKNFKDLNLKDFFIPNKYAFSVLVSLLVVFFSRIYLSNLLGLNSLEMGGVGLGQLKKQINVGFLGLFSGIEFFWVVILFGGMMLVQYKKYFALFCFFMLSVAIILGASFVADLTRSITYVFPMIIISFLIIKDELSLTTLKALSFIITISSFVIGTYYVVGSDVYFIFSAPMIYLTQG